MEKDMSAMCDNIDENNDTKQVSHIELPTKNISNSEIKTEQIVSCQVKNSTADSQQFNRKNEIDHVKKTKSSERIETSVAKIQDTSRKTLSPSKSPSYVKKPLPINEPKPVLPKSKQLKMESIPNSCVLPIIRASVIEEENSSGESIIDKTTVIEKQIKSKNINVPVDTQESLGQIKTEEHSIKQLTGKKQNSSPKAGSRKRPSTLMLEKKEKPLRSSAVSATPSSDSSKSSRTFEFLDYDSDTKEKILKEAIKEEDAFLEYVTSLNILPDPVIEAGNSKRNKKVSVFFYFICYT